MGSIMTGIYLVSIKFNVVFYFFLLIILNEEQFIKSIVEKVYKPCIFSESETFEGRRQ